MTYHLQHFMQSLCTGQFYKFSSAIHTIPTYKFNTKRALNIFSNVRLRVHPPHSGIKNLFFIYDGFFTTPYNRRRIDLFTIVKNCGPILRHTVLLPPSYNRTSNAYISSIDLLIGKWRLADYLKCMYSRNLFFQSWMELSHQFVEEIFLYFLSKRHNRKWQAVEVWGTQVMYITSS